MTRKTRTNVAEVAKLLRSTGLMASVSGKGKNRRVVQFSDKYNGTVEATYSKAQCEKMVAEMVANNAETS